ncbi:unnamed protein product [Euphydryas editha]|uniref:Uncharacterized protein n=1 Tax=Euphydryas editha TaxID=104508 RepID=A0AAU9UNT6_EUPED|nr:unnamed protein product [Euphydryas editha]
MGPTRIRAVQPLYAISSRLAAVTVNRNGKRVRWLAAETKRLGGQPLVPITNSSPKPPRRSGEPQLDTWSWRAAPLRPPRQLLNYKPPPISKQRYQSRDIKAEISKQRYHHQGRRRLPSRLRP